MGVEVTEQFRKEHVYTNNKGWLKELEGFHLMRGVTNKDKTMGYAKDKDGTIYRVVVADCGAGSSCFCAAKAIKTQLKEVV